MQKEDRQYNYVTSQILNFWQDDTWVKSFYVLDCSIKCQWEFDMMGFKEIVRKLYVFSPFDSLFWRSLGG